MLDGLTGDLIKAELRSENVYTSRQVVRFIGQILKKYLENYPKLTICIRADSGFAIPELYKIAEELETLYAIRLKVNSTLYKLASDIAFDLAYNLNNWFRRLCFSPNMKKNRIETIRTKVIKVAARIVKSARYLIIRFYSS